MVVAVLGIELHREKGVLLLFAPAGKRQLLFSRAGVDAKQEREVLLASRSQDDITVDARQHLAARRIYALKRDDEVQREIGLTILVGLRVTRQ